MSTQKCWMRPDPGHFSFPLCVFAEHKKKVEMIIPDFHDQKANTCSYCGTVNTKHDDDDHWHGIIVLWQPWRDWRPRWFLCHACRVDPLKMSELRIVDAIYQGTIPVRLQESWITCSGFKYTFTEIPDVNTEKHKDTLWQIYRDGWKPGQDIGTQPAWLRTSRNDVDHQNGKCNVRLEMFDGFNHLNLPRSTIQKLLDSNPNLNLPEFKFNWSCGSQITIARLHELIMPKFQPILDAIEPFLDLTLQLVIVKTTDTSSLSSVMCSSSSTTAAVSLNIAQ